MKHEHSSLDDNIITAHTSVMWKYNEIKDCPEKFPEYRFSECYDTDKLFKVTAASVRGKIHKYDGTNCDDYYSYAFSGGMVFAAVSDGAGSKKFSRIGAKTAAETAVATAKELFTSYFNENTDSLKNAALPYDNAEFGNVVSTLAEKMRTAVKTAANEIKRTSNKKENDEEFTNFLGRKCTISDFSTTLLLTAVVPVYNPSNSDMEYLILSVQIGDGNVSAINYYDDYSSALCILGNPDSGEFSGETDFITSDKMISDESIMTRTRVTRRKCTEILMMTDGVADDYFPADKEILRLYLDLCVNDIIKCNEEITKNDIFPHPIKNVWVNDNNISFEYQYISECIEKSGLSLENLWNDKKLCMSASLKAFGINTSGNSSERLRDWLDNYVRRGSFDDRTLLIISMKGNCNE